MAGLKDTRILQGAPSAGQRKTHTVSAETVTEFTEYKYTKNVSTPLLYNHYSAVVNQCLAYNLVTKRCSVSAQALSTDIFMSY